MGKKEHLGRTWPHAYYELAKAADAIRKEHEDVLDQWFPKREENERAETRENRLSLAAEAVASRALLWSIGADPMADLVEAFALRNRKGWGGNWVNHDAGRLALEAYGMALCLKAANNVIVKAPRVGRALVAARKERRRQWKAWGLAKSGFGIWAEETKETLYDGLATAFEGHTTRQAAPNVGVLVDSIRTLVERRGVFNDGEILELVRKVRPLLAPELKFTPLARRALDARRAEARRLQQREVTALSSPTFAGAKTDPSLRRVLEIDPPISVTPTCFQSPPGDPTLTPGQATAKGSRDDEEKRSREAPRGRGPLARAGSPEDEGSGRGPGAQGADASGAPAEGRRPEIRAPFHQPGRLHTRIARRVRRVAYLRLERRGAGGRSPCGKLRPP